MKILNVVLRLGVHVSIRGGISNAPDRAYERGCTTFQMFTRNPRGWRYSELRKDEVLLFKEKVYRYGYKRYVVAHMPYLPNLASPKEEIYKKSLESIINELNRSGELEIPYLVIHLGSHMGKGIETGRKNLVNAIDTALSKVDNEVYIILENMAGQKNSVGSSFEDIAIIIDKLSFKDRVGVCLDTAHAFAAGYDLRTKFAVEQTLNEFERIVGFKWLRVIHLNDSKAKLGSGRDIHEHIGMGYIGEDGFRYLLKDPRINRLPIILETPVDKRREDIGNIIKIWELSDFEPPDFLKEKWSNFLESQKKTYAKVRKKKNDKKEL